MGRKEIVYALTVRVLVAVLTQTFFQPDEYFQSLEPAHHFVFGYGALTWEWLNPLPIRSFIYPALNVPIYWFLKVTGVHQIPFWGDLFVVEGPKVLHGILAAGTDIWLCKLTEKTIGRQFVPTALLLSLSSFFNALSLSRSLSNSFETTLSTIAYANYPWTTNQTNPSISDIRRSLLFAALACAIRPTSAVIWLFLFAHLLWQRKSMMFTVISNALAIGVMTISVVVFIDTLYYGRPVLTPANFLITNLSNVSLFYGGNPWHFYVLQALPILCTSALPFVLHGVWTSLNGVHSATRTMSMLVLWTISIYSTTGHKEWRFIHPILPLLHVLASKSIVELSQRKSKEEKPKAEANCRPSIHSTYLYMILAQIPVAAYIVMLYCNGPIAVMSFIRNIPSDQLTGGSFGVLMPCHSIPGHAYIHRPELAHGGIWALGCEPPLQGQNLSIYRDQTNIFYESPITYMLYTFPPSVDPNFPVSLFPATLPGTPPSLQSKEKYPWTHEWPRHFIFFGALLDSTGMKNLLEGNGYQEVWRGGRWWEGDGDERKGGVHVWKWMA